MKQKRKKYRLKQTKEMVAVSDANHPNVDKSVTLKIKVPEVNAVKTDSLSVLAALFSNTEERFYTFGTTTDILKHLYARYKFSVYKQRFYRRRMSQLLMYFYSKQQ